MASFTRRSRSDSLRTCGHHGGGIGWVGGAQQGWSRGGAASSARAGCAPQRGAAPARVLNRWPVQTAVVCSTRPRGAANGVGLPRAPAPHLARLPQLPLHLLQLHRQPVALHGRQGGRRQAKRAVRGCSHGVGRLACRRRLRLRCRRSAATTVGAAPCHPAGAPRALPLASCFPSPSKSCFPGTRTKQEQQVRARHLRVHVPDLLLRAIQVGLGVLR